jgi:colicin import membrane protein
MTDRPVSDFMLSATLHAVVIGSLLAFSYVAQQQVKNMPQVMELVAGEGDNFGAKVAPALGIPGGVKLDVPAPPAPKVEPAPLKPVEEPPVAKAPEPAPPPAPKAAPEPVRAATTPPPAPNFAQQIRRKLIRAESKAKADVAKERKAEAKRLEEEKKRMTKAEFDKQNKAAGSPTKVARIDAEGIAKGVVGGSTANKVGGAGGKALTSDNEDLLGAYFALFKQRLKVAFEAPDGLSDTLEVVVRVTSNADGSLTNPRVVKSSGSAEFDRAVVAAIRKVTMPARPDRRSEPIDVPFSMREREDR